MAVDRKIITWRSSQEVTKAVIVALIAQVEQRMRSDMTLSFEAKYMDSWSMEDVEVSKQYWPGNQTVSSPTGYNSGSFMCALAAIKKVSKIWAAHVNEMVLPKSNKPAKWGKVLTRHVKKRKKGKPGPKKGSKRQPKPYVFPQ